MCGRWCLTVTPWPRRRGCALGCVAAGRHTVQEARRTTIQSAKLLGVRVRVPTISCARDARDAAQARAAKTGGVRRRDLDPADPELGSGYRIAYTFADRSGPRRFEKSEFVKYIKNGRGRTEALEQAPKWRKRIHEQEHRPNARSAPCSARASSRAKQIEKDRTEVKRKQTTLKNRRPQMRARLDHRHISRTSNTAQ